MPLQPCAAGTRRIRRTEPAVTVASRSGGIAVNQSGPRRRSRRPVASPQHWLRRITHHCSRQQRGVGALPACQLRHAGRERATVGRHLPGRRGRDRDGDPHDPRRRPAVRGRSRLCEELRRRDESMGHTTTRPRDSLRPSCPRLVLRQAAHAPPTHRSPSRSAWLTSVGRFNQLGSPVACPSSCNAVCV